MKGCFECVEEIPIEDGVVRAVHIYYIESYIFGRCVAEAAERYRQIYGAYRLNSSAPETIQRLCCLFQLFSIEAYLIEG
jgi:hypothetical protein